ncbi:MAG: amidase [Fimbriimonadaceae bacterium]|nr:MAG: Asp-tRNAAsn/Glu-tRNAGln amidotransferase A subunit [Armatimonadetes bacterium OLB18]WKZ80939.1 MAG: amidase [Fimbriimonadaceae bacterium]
MASTDSIDRREFFARAVMGAATAGLPLSTALGAPVPNVDGQDSSTQEIGLADLQAAAKIAGLEFENSELEEILRSVRSQRASFAALRSQEVDYTLEPPTPFVPQGKSMGGAPGIELRLDPPSSDLPPSAPEDLAFSSVRDLGHWVRTRKVSPVELTRLYLDRMKKYGDELLCLVTLTEELALEQARRAEAEIAAGQYRGPLHGLPYGIKDLFATKGYPTSWGSEPHKDQVFDYDAGVIERMREAGAVLIAKLSLGSLAQGDVWFKGRTKNPWNPAQGSSGSSAGSACSAAAGLAAFTIGTETLGSIVSPTHQCRVTGLRPSYGRVTRSGAMAVSWTMDKVGPICRSAQDCAIVFASLQGSDPRDLTSRDAGFHYRSDLPLKELRIGYLIGPSDDPADRSAIERTDYLSLFASLGANLEPVRLSPTPNGVILVLSVESASAFDDFTRSDAIDRLQNSSWPETYRSSRFVPAVEYLRAQRLRTEVMRKFEAELGEFDLVVAYERGGHTLYTTNLTGHPQVLVPFGLTPQGTQRSISLIGRLDGEATILAVAHQIQMRAGFHRLRPSLG